MRGTERERERESEREEREEKTEKEEERERESRLYRYHEAVWVNVKRITLPRSQELPCAVGTHF